MRVAIDDLHPPAKQAGLYVGRSAPNGTNLRHSGMLKPRMCPAGCRTLFPATKMHKDSQKPAKKGFWGDFFLCLFVAKPIY